MKLVAFLGFLAVVCCQFGPGKAGKTFLVNPATSFLPESRYVRTLPQTRLKRSWTSPKFTRYVRSLPRTRFTRSWTSPKFTPSWTSPRNIRSWRMPRGMPTTNLYNKEFTQQRVLRTPISKTVTILPNEVTRIQRNIKTHMPMVHERVRHHYNVENVNKKNIIHHYVEPVQNKRLGTRKGRSARLGTEHVLHRNRMFNPLRFANEQGEEDLIGGDELEDVDTDVAGNYWKILKGESCQDTPAGQSVRPEAVCMCNSQVCDNDNCNQLPFPEDIVC